MSSAVYREWSPLEHVVSRIPVRVAGNIPGLGVEQEITCLATHPGFLALGTSAGLVYWYDRVQDLLKKLDCFPLVPITCIQLVETVDLMVAVGSHEGDVTIFQIPKVVNRNGQEVSQAPTSPQSIQQFSIRGVHSRAITALAWSVNGQKLMSGDMGGVVNCSTVDYFLRQTTTRPVSREDSQIVQLDYKQRLLLVASLHDCRLVKGAGEEGGVQEVPVGKKPRRAVGQACGGVFKSDVMASRTKAVVVRPNNRLWVADIEGVVERTVIFKAALEKTHSQIVVINPVSIAGDDDGDQFEKVEMLRSEDDEELAVVWSSKRFHITNLVTGVVVASCHSLRRILDLSVCAGEIFVLETGRTVIRIAKEKDHEQMESNWRRSSTASQGSDSETPMGLLSANIARKLPNISRSAFANLSSPLKLPNIPGFDAGSSFYNFGAKLRTLGSRGESVTSPEVSSPAEEAFESPSEENSKVGSDARKDVHVSKEMEVMSPNSYSTMEMYKSQMDRIGEQDFDNDIAVTKKVKKHGKKSKLDQSVPDTDIDSNSNMYTYGDQIVENEILQDDIIGSLNGLKLELSVETSDIKVTHDDMDVPIEMNDKSDLKSSDLGVNDKSSNLLEMDATSDAFQNDNLHKSVIELHKFNTKPADDDLDMDEVKQTLDDKEEFLTKILHLDERPASIVDAARYSLDHEHSGDNEHSNILHYGPPSDSSAATTSIISRDASLHNSHPLPETTPETKTTTTLSSLENDKPSEDMSPNSSMTELSSGWMSYSLPGRACSLAVTSQYVVICDDRETVFYSGLGTGQGLVWRRADFTATKVDCSCSGAIVWKILRHTAYALMEPVEDKPVGSRWVEVMDGVAGIAVGEEAVWIVGLDGGITVHASITSSSPYCLQSVKVLSGFSISSLKLSGYDLVAVAGDGSVFSCCVEDVDCRRSKKGLLELEWARVKVPCATVADVVVRQGGELWVIDSHNSVYFSMDWKDMEAMSWWRISVVESGSGSGGEEVDWRAQEGLVPRSLCRPCLAAGPRSVYLVMPLANNLIMSPSVIRGFSWSKVDLSNLGAGGRLKDLSAGGIQDYKGLLYMTQFAMKPNPDLLCCPLHNWKVSTIPLPLGDSVLQVATSPGHVWLLTVQGAVFIGKNYKWTRLDLHQLAGVRLVSLALGKDCVWAADHRGDVHLRLGALSPPTPNALPAWVQVDPGDRRNVDEEAKIVTVVCSTEPNIVWCLDSSNMVYVREAVYPELPVGTSWLHVSGLAAVAIAASRQTVWVLTPTKQVYRRRGVTSTNWVGDAWEHIPSPQNQAVALSVSQCDTAWALDRCGVLQQLAVRRLQMEGAALEERMDSIGEDWAVVL